ncbi:MAG: flagellar export protein FliJ [Pseudomonadota bacterium]
MPQRSKLGVVKRVAHQRALQAQRKTVQSRAKLDESRAQLLQLVNYREEYNRRFLELGDVGMGAGDMQEFQAFLSRVDKAIDLQRRIIDENSGAWQNSHAIWQEIRAHEASLEELLAARLRTDYREAERRDQKQTDEGSSQRALRNRQH